VKKYTLREILDVEIAGMTIRERLRIIYCDDKQALYELKSKLKGKK
jgi:hypothetical protein